MAYAYGIDPLRVPKLSSKLVDTLWLCLTQIEAQDMLLKMTLADWPNMKKSPRETLHRKIFFQAFPDEVRAKNRVTPKDLFKLLGGSAKR